ncbi:hypothetical protein PORY_002445 [Pneumocystis oryctolagi]|uniref:Uncharacterized protein n=1 Tax=Pneumocystis oryctolagi TaxID=42067 RepID=A0ACB7C8U0_9ASCO|nr:hypothetical protein PORY_002445 [Pneumocystis oryctolagi]
MSSSEEETEESMESVEGLVKGREKRITAGNRLQALLDQEFEAEEMFDVSNDQDEDFDGDKHSLQDIEISESDDEEEASPGEYEEREIEKEEKKACPFGIKKKKPPEAFFKPRSFTEVQKKKPKPKTFTIVHPDSIRHSSRAHTIENKNIINRRLKEAQEKKERLTHFVKVKQRPMTQEERIAEAKITEEKNKALFQRFIKMEEEKKKNIRSMLRTNKTIAGPFIRFWSRGVEQLLNGKWVFPHLKNTNANQEGCINDTKNLSSNTSSEFTEVLQDETKKSEYPSKEEELEKENKINDTVIQEQTSDIPTHFHTNDKQSNESTGKNIEEHESPLQGPSLFSARNYIILESFPEPFDLDKQKKTLFSCTDVSIKQEKHICFITGKVAKYKDPVSGLYYNDISAYQTIHQIINGNIPWSRVARTFVGTLKPAQGVPLNFYNTTTSNE